MELRASLEIIQRVSGEILEESSEFDDSPAEELANSLTHGFGLLLSAIGFVFLVVLSSLRGTAWHIVSFTVYGASLVLCYGASTLYHSLRAPDWKQLFHKLDHAAIFVLIAGTYTPFLLVSLRGPWGWSMFGIVWSLGLAGVVFKLMYADRFRVASVVVYVLMGWLILIAFKPMLAAVPAGGLWWVFLSRPLYTFGKNFFFVRRIPEHPAGRP